MDITLFENQCIADEGEAENARVRRILWVPPERQIVSLIDLGEQSALPTWCPYGELLEGIENHELLVLDVDPAASRWKPDSKLSDAEQAIRNRRNEIISPLVSDPERRILDAASRGKMIKDRSLETGVSASHIYRFLRRWWQLGQLTNALVPEFGRCGAPGEEREAGEAKRGRPRHGSGTEVPVGINVTRQVADNLKDGTRFLKKGDSLQQAYDKTLTLHFSEQVIEDGLRRNQHLPLERLPSIEQFRYWTQKALRRGDIQRAVSGETGFARKNRPRTGTAKDLSFGPGAIYQIDATIANIYLRSRLDPSRLIGRPVLYLVLDHYSRMMVGFSVGLSGPSWEVGKLALENAYTDKVTSCAKHNVIIGEQDWPAKHLCSRLTGDRGWSELGKNAGAAGRLLGYTVANLPPYRPDLKGLVESRLEFLDHTDIKFAPGASQGRERGDPKHKLDGVYTVDTFCELIIRCMLRYNSNFAVNDPPSSFKAVDGRAPTPVELWNYGCRACASPQIADSERVRRSLLHGGNSHESDKGLRFRGLHYLPEDPSKFEWFVRVHGRKWHDREIRYDPRDAASIFLVLNGGTTFERCRLIEGCKEYAGWTFDEVADWFARKRIATRLNEDHRLLINSKHEAQIAALEERVRAQVAATPLVNPTAAGDRELRAKELRELRRTGAWTSDPPAPVHLLVTEPPAQHVASGSSAPQSAEVIPLKPDFTKMLRARRDAAVGQRSEE